MTTTDHYADSLDAGATTRIASVIRAIFPHDALAEGPYQRSAEAIVTNVSPVTHQLAVVVEGIRSLDALAGGDLTALSTDELSAILRHIEQTEFFQLLLTSAVVTLYSDPETWSLLGYEGPSFDKGGYINRGFDDLDWLPDPRVEEYDGDDRLVGYVPAVPGLQISFDQTKKVATI